MNFWTYQFDLGVHSAQEIWGFFCWELAHGLGGRVFRQLLERLAMPVQAPARLISAFVTEKTSLWDKGFELVGSPYFNRLLSIQFDYPKNWIKYYIHLDR